MTLQIHSLLFKKESLLSINKVKLNADEPEKLSIFERRRNSPNYWPPIIQTKESVISYISQGSLFGLEDSFTENPKKDQTVKRYSYKVVSTKISWFNRSVNLKQVNFSLSEECRHFQKSVIMMIVLLLFEIW